MSWQEVELFALGGVSDGLNTSRHLPSPSVSPDGFAKAPPLQAVDQLSQCCFCRF